MKKLMKISALILALVMLLSFSVSAASGTYNIMYQEDNEDGEYVAATINGNYHIGFSKSHQIDTYTLEVGASVTIQLPTKGLYILDGEKEYYDDDISIAFANAGDGSVRNSDRCTITNLVKKTNVVGGIEQTFYQKGIKITFHKPGVYMFDTFGADEADTIRSNGFHESFTVVEKGGIAKMEEEERLANTARYNNAKVLVNGVPTTFEAYNFSGNNYFKLRDLAMAVNGTEKQFEISWNERTKQITIWGNTGYTPVGGELAAGDGKDKIGTPYETPLNYNYLYAVEAKAYNINGNNYFKLRDVCKLLDIGVTWDNNTKTIGIDTSISYTE